MPLRAETDATRLARNQGGEQGADGQRAGSGAKRDWIPTGYAMEIGGDQAPRADHQGNP